MCPTGADAFGGRHGKLAVRTAAGTAAGAGIWRAAADAEATAGTGGVRYGCAD